MIRSGAVLLLALLVAVPAVAEDPPGPAEFVAGAHRRHLDLTAAGLESFSARLVIRRASDPNVRRLRDRSGFVYSWSAPAKEEFDFAETLPALQKPWRDVMGGLWREATNALWFQTVEETPGLTLSVNGDFTVITGSLEGKTAFTATFETASKRFNEILFPAADTRVAWFASETGVGLRVWGREVTIKGVSILKQQYRALRDVNGFSLPTVIRFETANGRTDFDLEYLLVNGRAADVEVVSRKMAKAAVNEFESGWKGWPDLLKIEKIRDLSEIGHDLVSTAIAKLGLSDRASDVRAEAAASLGAMRRENVVPALLKALAANEDEIAVYVAIVDALGDIGDPRAVPALGGDWWSQKGGLNAVAAAKAKIHALGSIRHVTSVDGLIDTFTVTSAERIGWVKADIVEALNRLTGENFGDDQSAWKDWWKKRRSGFKF